MKEKKASQFKNFAGKSVLIITKSNFHYHTDELKVFGEYVEFVDKFGSDYFLSNDEIKLIQEIKQ